MSPRTLNRQGRRGNHSRCEIRTARYHPGPRRFTLHASPTANDTAPGPRLSPITYHISLITFPLPCPHTPAKIIPRYTPLMKLRRMGPRPFGPNRCGRAMVWRGRNDWDGSESAEPKEQRVKIENSTSFSGVSLANVGCRKKSEDSVLSGPARQPEP